MKTVNVYFVDRPDMDGCHVFEDLRRAGEILDPGASVSDRWRDDVDVNVCVDTGHVLPPPPGRRDRSRFWCLHCHLPGHQGFAHAFDRTFGVDVHWVRRGLFDEWLPNGVGSAVRPLDVEPEVDVGFIGQFLGNRVRVADAVRRICDRRGWTHRLVDSMAGRSGREGPGMRRPSWVSAGDFNQALASCRVWLNATTEPWNHLLNNRVFEGMAAGRPVVSDVVEGARSLVADGAGVLYYDWRRPESVELPLERLLNDEPLYARVAAAGRKEADRHSMAARLRVLAH